MGEKPEPLTREDFLTAYTIADQWADRGETHARHFELVLLSKVLLQLDWLARDFVWSCPDPPDHPTYAALVEYFDGIWGEVG